jgi:hypothetical protein
MTQLSMLLPPKTRPRGNLTFLSCIANAAFSVGVL